MGEEVEPGLVEDELLGLSVRNLVLHDRHLLVVDQHLAGRPSEVGERGLLGLCRVLRVL